MNQQKWIPFTLFKKLTKGDVLLVYGTSAIVKTSNNWIQYISIDELENSNRIKLPHRSTWIASRFILRYLCSHLTGVHSSEIVFEKTTNGKPFFKDNPFYFNISHSGDAFMIAITFDSEVGVDMEVVTEIDMTNVAEYAFSKAERRISNNGKNLERSYEVWTLKEAYLKAIGVGLIDNLSEIDVTNTKLLFHRKGLHPYTFQTPRGEIASLVVAESVSNILAYAIPDTFQL